MFYCEQCRAERKWPGAVPVSYGRCEICGRIRGCFDIPSKELPPPPYNKKGTP